MAVPQWKARRAPAGDPQDEVRINTVAVCSILNEDLCMWKVSEKFVRYFLKASYIYIYLLQVKVKKKNHIRTGKSDINY